MSEEYRINASIDDAKEELDQFKKSDPFNQTWDELKSFSGLDNNFKRRASRMSKVEASDAYMTNARAISSGVDGFIYRVSQGRF